MAIGISLFAGAVLVAGLWGISSASLGGCSGSTTATASSGSAAALAVVSSAVAPAVVSSPAAPAPSGPQDGIVDWKTPKDAVADLAANGISCRGDGSEPGVSKGTDERGKPSNAIIFIQCDGFTVLLVRDVDRAHAIEKAVCESAPAKAWDSFDISEGLTGTNFYILSSNEDHHFPKNARLEDFQKALGGVIETDA
jgi:hypothetical protein